MRPISRRMFLGRAFGVGGAVALAPALAGCAGRAAPAPPRWAGRFLTVVSTGGALRHALAAAGAAFARATGCRVMDLSLPVDALDAELRRQGAGGRTEWDVVALDAPRLAIAARELPAFFAPLADLRVEGRERFPPGLPASGVAILADALALAVRSAPFAGRVPRDWPELWETATFPGPRHFPRDPVGLLEVALLADGAEAARLYPLDLDRAFRSLDRLRPAIRAWWTNPDRAGEALTLGEADCILGREGDLSAAIEGGAIATLAPLPVPALPLALATPQRAPNGDVAREFLAFCAQAAAQRALGERGYQPLGAPGAPRAFPPDLAWWGQQGRGALDRFALWLGR